MMLDEEGKETLEVAVCQEASEKSPRAFWAFRRLGYLQLHQKKWSEAVQSFQHAIRGYVTCADLWEVCILVSEIIYPVSLLTMAWPCPFNGFSFTLMFLSSIRLWVLPTSA